MEHFSRLKFFLCLTSYAERNADRIYKKNRMRRLGFPTHKILFILSKFKATAPGLMQTGFR